MDDWRQSERDAGDEVMLCDGSITSIFLHTAKVEEINVSHVHDPNLERPVHGLD